MLRNATCGRSILTILLIGTAVGHDPDDPAVVAALDRVSALLTALGQRDTSGGAVG